MGCESFIAPCSAFKVPRDILSRRRNKPLYSFIADFFANFGKNSFNYFFHLEIRSRFKDHFCRENKKAPYKMNRDNGYGYPVSIQFRTVLGGFSVLTEPAPLARFEIVVYIIQFSKRFRADFLCQQQSVRCLCAMSVFCGDRSTMESSALA